MKTYLDSSSFAKRFVDEAGSDGVEAACRTAAQLGLSVLCVPEIISALNRYHREKRLTRSQYFMAKRRLFEDIRDADVIHLTPAVVEKSIAVLESYPVRPLDALHIACALEWEAELFVSSDKRQLAAAEKMGLRTEKV